MRNFSRLVLTVLKIKTLGLVLASASALAVSQFNAAPVSAAVCASEPATATGKSTISITVPATDDYTIWSRLKAPSTSPVEYKVYLDGECFTIGQTALSANTLTWVDYENGSTSDKATVNLPAGTHTLVVTAGSPSLELDRVMLLSDGCTPTGTGDNCQNDTTLPTASITAPTNGATVSGTTTITANATDNDAIDRVEFYRGGTTLLGSDSVAPYTYSWNTTSLADGAQSLTVRVYDLSGNVRTSTAVSVTVNNTPAVNANITSFTATPSTITNGQSSTLAWNVSAGTGCSINQGVGSVGLSGSQSVSPTTTTTYTLTCNGTGGGSSATANATVTVNPAPVNANITSFAATPSTITNGQNSTLAWSVAVGTGCSINQSVGSVGTSGSQSVGPTTTTTYTLTCSGLNGGSSATANATVTVNPAPVAASISSFTATPATITVGQGTTLAWSVAAGTGCTVNQGVGAVNATGSQTVTPTSTTTYTMTCSGLNGGASASANATVTVNPAPVAASITSFTASSSSITAGQSSTLSWNVASGTGCTINQGVGSVGLTGTHSVSPATTTTYTLACNGTNGGASATATATVTVSATPVDASITSFAASPTSITVGQSSTLSWSVSAGTGCAINQSVGGVATSGTRTVSPTATTTYTLTCNGLNGGDSDSASVTVTATAPIDTDGDGIMDHIEDAGPNSGDANYDGTPDAQQAGVASFLNSKTNAYNTLVTLGTDCEVVDGLTSAASTTSVQGVWSFTIDCDSPGQTAQVKLYLDKQYDFSNWKVNKYSTDLSESVDITSRATFANETLGSRSVTTLRYDITDGGYLDEDGVANGTIVDPLGIVAGAATIDDPAAGTGDTGGELSNTGVSIFAVLSAAVAVVVAAGIGLAYYARTIAFASRR